MVLGLLVKGLKNFKTRGLVADGLECVVGKVFDGSLSSIFGAIGVSRGAAIAFASRDKNVNYDFGTYSQVI